MRNMSEIRHNIRAVEETRQITNAMFLLSTARMKRAVQEVGHNKEYIRRICAVMKNVLRTEEIPPSIFTAFDERRGDSHPAFLVISSDKGLCGAYNQSICRFALEEINKTGGAAEICTVGEHAATYLMDHGLVPDVQFTGAAQRHDTYYARAIGEHFLEFFKEGRITSLRVIYTHYHNQSIQEPRCFRLLPVLAEDLQDGGTVENNCNSMIFEPNPAQLFEQLVTQYVIGIIYECLNQASCSEQVARMTAMQNATKNADEMLQKLGTQFNAVRQLAITNEITEIAAAASLADHAV